MIYAAQLSRWLVKMSVVACLVLVIGCQGVSRDVVDPGVVYAPSTSRMLPNRAPAEPLSVSISVFDYETPGRLLAPVREAESGYMAVTLANAMQNSGQWAGVEVLPVVKPFSEVQVTGSIRRSGAGELLLSILVVDSRGDTWLERQYLATASDDAYAADAPVDAEVFMHLYYQVANDIAEVQRERDPGDRQRIRQTALIRYARDLAPDAFRDYVLERTDESGRSLFEVTGLPARDDPVFALVLAFQARELAITELIDMQYRRFHGDLLGVYPFWRRYLHELSADNERRRPVGGSWGATEAVYRQYEEVRLNEDRLRVLTESFRTESRSTTADLAGTVVELTGSLEQQYLRWRSLLRQRFLEDRGGLSP